MSVTTVLFPSSYFNDREVDEALRAEYDAVIETGLFEVALFSYDKWINERLLCLEHAPLSMTSAVYRGWMMKPEVYAELYERLLTRNIRLITSPEEYRRFHIFPNIYPELAEDTARMIAYPDVQSIDLDEIKRSFKRFMVKDFVKSVKGTDFPKYFDSTVTAEEFGGHMERFIQHRGGLLTGGICIKEYLSLKTYGGRTNEYRVFYAGSRAVSVSRNSGQGSFAPTPPRELIEKYGTLASPYYTVDFAQLDDGSWRIIEAGDGQVSGLSDGQDMNAYFRALYMALDTKLT